MNDKHLADRLLISIIIPIFNVEKWLNECLESCVIQNIGTNEYEIICVDDGSTDNSGKIVDEYAKKHTQIIPVHKKNGGVSTARNVGLEMAKGDYVWFVDGDDFIAYNCLKDIADYLIKTKPDLLFVKPLAFYDGKETQKMKSGSVAPDETTDFYYDWLWTRLFKKECVIQSGIRFNSNARIAQDNLFCTEFDNCIYNKVQYDGICYFYRKRANSAATTPTLKKINNIIETCKEFVKLKERCPQTIEKSNLQIYSFMQIVMSNLAKLPNKEAKPYIEKMKKYKLYPLKRLKEYDDNTADYSNMSFDNRVLAKLKNISYTRCGYNTLRAFRKYLKVKRKLVK